VVSVVVSFGVPLDVLLQIFCTEKCLMIGTRVLIQPVVMIAMAVVALADVMSTMVLELLLHADSFVS